ncbi:acetoacetate decarboxylase family protein [Steroidobacter sp. S1-65]|uniref:Acetoacetate decarboxylase family protein n=2 Tax=Steroidobacter gossypii TaxID=2805490 RepID=A0ABS1WQV0_9GAMM|nr:acetoacetate decarboxylase family protein [Steroidobacter gossypii]
MSDLSAESLADPFAATPGDESHLPPAPWTLHGEALIGFKLVPEDLARRLIPPDARIFRVWPGRTVAMLYLSEYRQSPVGEYRELIFAPALVRRKGRIGFWIAHILVDKHRSLLAGRAIWSLPKQAASIQWNDGCVRLSGPQVKLQVVATRPRAMVRLPFAGAAMSMLGPAESWFPVRGAAGIGLARARVEVADEIGLSALGFGGVSTFIFCRHMRVTIQRPTMLSSGASNHEPDPHRPPDCSRS